MEKLERINEAKQVGGTNYILDKLIRDYPMLNNLSYSSVDCEDTQCDKSVTRYQLDDSISIELLKPHDPNRRIKLYCTLHSQHILEELKNNRSQYEYNKAIDEGHIIANTMRP